MGDMQCGEDVSTAFCKEYLYIDTATPPQRQQRSRRSAGRTAASRGWITSAGSTKMIPANAGYVRAGFGSTSFRVSSSPWAMGILKQYCEPQLCHAEAQ
jgi:hypothetical protein